MPTTKTAPSLVFTNQISNGAVFRLGQEDGHCVVVWPSGAFNAGKRYKAISLTPDTAAAAAFNSYDYDNRLDSKMAY